MGFFNKMFGLNKTETTQKNNTINIDANPFMDERKNNKEIKKEPIKYVILDDVNKSFLKHKLDGLFSRMNVINIPNINIGDEVIFDGYNLNKSSNKYANYNYRLVFDESIYEQSIHGLVTSFELITICDVLTEDIKIDEKLLSSLLDYINNKKSDFLSVEAEYAYIKSLISCDLFYNNDLYMVLVGVDTYNNKKISLPYRYILTDKSMIEDTIALLNYEKIRNDLKSQLEIVEKNINNIKYKYESRFSK